MQQHTTFEKESGSSVYSMVSETNSVDFGKHGHGKLQNKSHGKSHGKSQSNLPGFSTPSSPIIPLSPSSSFSSTSALKRQFQATLSFGNDASEDGTHGDSNKTEKTRSIGDNCHTISPAKKRPRHKKKGKGHPIPATKEDTFSTRSNSSITSISLYSKNSELFPDQQHQKGKSRNVWKYTTKSRTRTDSSRFGVFFWKPDPHPAGPNNNNKSAIGRKSVLVYCNEPLLTLQDIHSTKEEEETQTIVTARQAKNKSNLKHAPIVDEDEEEDEEEEEEHDDSVSLTSLHTLPRIPRTLEHVLEKHNQNIRPYRDFFPSVKMADWMIKHTSYHDRRHGSTALPQTFGALLQTESEVPLFFDFRFLQPLETLEQTWSCRFVRILSKRISHHITRWLETSKHHGGVGSSAMHSLSLSHATAATTTTNLFSSSSSMASASDNSSYFANQSLFESHENIQNTVTRSAIHPTSLSTSNKSAPSFASASSLSAAQQNDSSNSKQVLFPQAEVWTDFLQSVLAMPPLYHPTGNVALDAANSSHDQHSFGTSINDDGTSTNSNHHHPHARRPRPRHYQHQPHHQQQQEYSNPQHPSFWAGVSTFPLPKDAAEQHPGAWEEFLASTPKYRARQLFSWKHTSLPKKKGKNAQSSSSSNTTSPKTHGYRTQIPGGLRRPSDESRVLQSKLNVFPSLEDWYAYGQEQQRESKKLTTSRFGVGNGLYNDDDDDDDDDDGRFVEVGMRITFPFVLVSRSGAAFLREQLVSCLTTPDPSGEHLPNLFDDALLVTCYCASSPQPFTFQRFFYPCRHCYSSVALSAAASKTRKSGDEMDVDVDQEEEEENEKGDASSCLPSCACDKGRVMVQTGFQFFGIQTAGPTKVMLDDLSMTDAERIMWTTPLSAMQCDHFHPQQHLVRVYPNKHPVFARMLHAIPTTNFPLSSDPTNTLDKIQDQAKMHARLYTPTFGSQGERIGIPNKWMLDQIFALVCKRQDLLFRPDQCDLPYVQHTRRAFEAVFSKIHPAYTSLRMFLAVKSNDFPRANGVTQNAHRETLYANQTPEDQQIFATAVLPFVRCIVYGPGSGFCGNMSRAHWHSVIEIFFFRLKTDPNVYFPAVYCPECQTLKFFSQETICSGIASTDFLIRQFSYLLGSKKIQEEAVQLNRNDFPLVDNKKQKLDNKKEDENDGSKSLLHDRNTRINEAFRWTRKKLFDPEHQENKQALLSMITGTRQASNNFAYTALSNEDGNPSGTDTALALRNSSLTDEERDRSKMMLLAHSSTGVFVSESETRPQNVMHSLLLQKANYLSKQNAQDTKQTEERINQEIDLVKNATNARFQALEEEKEIEDRQGKNMVIFSEDDVAASPANGLLNFSSSTRALSSYSSRIRGSASSRRKNSTRLSMDTNHPCGDDDDDDDDECHHDVYHEDVCHEDDDDDDDDDGDDNDEKDDASSSNV